MDDVKAQLRKALGDQLVLGEELGGGGMSRVFVAEEMALGRKVVVKLLPPELAAGASLDRFRREIRVAAALQHPNIVPVLSAGSDGDVFWYTMPLVQGKSLRATLAKEHALSVPRALRILTEVCDALAHAHEHGVMHRDIKPDNILLTERHALVTDFGVARALDAAGQGHGLTSTGVSVGTPAYMAPEQAAAEPHVDHRADLYALGAVAWEMLAGRPLFVGSPQAVMSSHLSRTPESISGYRASVPPALEAVVMRCLSKEPADRWQTARELLAALESLDIRPTPSLPTAATQAQAAAANRPRRRVAAIATGLVALAALGAVALVRADRAGASEVRRSIVADFVSDDSTLGRVVTEAVRISLQQSAQLTQLSPGAVREALVRMQRPRDQPLDATTAREVATREGVPLVVTGEVLSLNGATVLHGRVEDPTGEVLASHQETAGSAGDLLAAIDRLGKALRRAAGESARSVRASKPLPEVSTGRLDALTAYAEALRAWYNEDDVDRAVAMFDRAIALDSNFAMAYRGLAIVLGNRRESRTRARGALVRAYALRDRLPDVEQFRVTASYYTSAEVNPEAAKIAYRSLLARSPQEVGALNNLGLVHTMTGDFDEAVALWEQAYAIDSTNPIVAGNVGFGYSLQNRLDDAEAHVRHIIAAQPQQARFHFQLAQLEAVRGNLDAADSLVRRIRDEFGSSGRWRPITSLALARTAAMRGRLRDARTLSEDAYLTLGAAELRAEALIEATNHAMLEVVTLGDADRGVASLEQALHRWKLETMPVKDRPYHYLALAYALAGRDAKARGLISEYERVVPATERALESPPMQNAVVAVLALNANLPDSALRSLARWDENPCRPCIQPLRARALEMKGLADSAGAVYTAFLAMHPLGSILLDAAGSIRFDTVLWDVYIRRRLAALLEARGDSAEAAMHLQSIAQRWANGDPEVRALARDAARRAAALRKDGPPA